jgi:hypothetical protein
MKKAKNIALLISCISAVFSILSDNPAVWIFLLIISAVVYFIMPSYEFLEEQEQKRQLWYDEQKRLTELNKKAELKIKDTENKNQRISAKERGVKDVAFRKVKSGIITKYDSDGDGLIDVMQSDDFQSILNRNKEVIIQKEKDKVQAIIKLTNYLKRKRENVQGIYESLINLEPVYVNSKYDFDDRVKKLIEANSDKGLSDWRVENNAREIVKSEKEFNSTHLEKMESILANEIQAYNMLIFHSINMVVSVRDGDLFTFYEIYETLDKLNVFNSNWENEVSNKLSNIEMGVGELLVSIDKMNTEIVNEISSLNYYTQESFSNLEASVTNELQGVNSKLGYSNLLATVNTYQLHNISSNTKKLIKR